jgi:hypothetical protein
LAIGLIGKRGTVLPGMHAWVEYFDGVWRTVDATGGSGPVRPANTEEQSNPIGTPAQVKSLQTGESSKDPPTFLSRMGFLSKYVTIIAAGVFVLGMILLLVYSKRSSENLISDVDIIKQRQMVAEMASLGSHLFGSMEAVVRSPAFPVLGSDRGMSRKEALALSKQGKLWCSNGDTKLAKIAAGKGARILDSSSESFARLIDRLPGIQNLDEISNLRQVSPRSLEGKHENVGELISQMNRILVGAGLKDGQILPCKGLLDSEVRDVDLSGLGFENGGPPSRFVAVSLGSEVINDNAKLTGDSIGLAAFLTLRYLVDKSGLLKPWKAQILKKAASVAMGEAK